jgi:hypothetical protein
MEYDLGRAISRYLSEDLRYVPNTKVATLYRDDAIDEWTFTFFPLMRAIRNEMSAEVKGGFTRKLMLKLTYDVMVKYLTGDMVQRLMEQFDRYTQRVNKFRKDGKDNQFIVVSRYLRHLSKVYDFAVGSCCGGISAAVPDEKHQWALEYTKYFRCNMHEITSDWQRFFMQKVLAGEISVYVCSFTFEQPYGCCEMVTKGVVGHRPIQLLTDFMSLHMPTPAMVRIWEGRIHFYFCVPKSEGKVVGLDAMKFEDVYCPSVGADFDYRDISIHGGKMLENGESLDAVNCTRLLEWNLKRHPDKVESYVKLAKAYWNVGMKNLAFAVAENAYYNTYIGDEEKFDMLRTELPDIVSVLEVARGTAYVWTDRIKAEIQNLDNGGFNPLIPTDDEWAEVGGFEIPKINNLPRVKFDVGSEALIDVK